MSVSKYFFLFLALVLFSCTPKVTEEIVEEPVKVVEPIKDTSNPCVTFADLEPAIKDEAETAYVLYKDFYDLKEYDEAMPLWRKAYKLAPAANGRVKYQFDHGIKMYHNLYLNVSDEGLKKRYVDTIMTLYDKRVECFQNEAYISGRKAYDLYYNYPTVMPEMDMYKMFKKSLDGKGNKADYFIINPMVKLLYDNFTKGEIPIEEARQYALKLSSAIDYGTKNCTTDCEAWKVINNYAPNRLEAFEATKGFYDCGYYKEKYFPQFEANKTDCETIQLVSRRLFYGGCDKEDPNIQALKTAYNTHCYSPPPPPGPCSVANKLYNEGKYQEAVAKFEECLATADNEKKAKYKLLIAKIYYRDLKDFSKSRKYALEAAALKANWGEPYMLIGKLYASSGPICGPGTGWDSQIVTWPAIDMWEKAKKLDPAVAAEANKLISQYKQYMPTKEDVFIRSLKPGQSYKVPCWIRESTTIRTAN